MGCMTSSLRIHVGALTFDAWNKPIELTSVEGYRIVLYTNIDIRDQIVVQLPYNEVMVLEYDYPLMIYFPHFEIFILVKRGGVSLLIDASFPDKLRYTVKYATQSRFWPIMSALRHVKNQPDASPCLQLIDDALAEQGSFVPDHDILEPIKRERIQRKLDASSTTPILVSPKHRSVH